MNWDLEQYLKSLRTKYTVTTVTNITSHSWYHFTAGTYAQAVRLSKVLSQDGLTTWIEECQS